jgi:hypothetical protein
MGRMRNGSNPSGNTDWETPEELLEALVLEFLGCTHERPSESAFDLDPCATEESNTAIICYSLDQGEDGLLLPWYGDVFVNPPYGRSVGRWVEKCYNEVLLGNAVTVVALLPASTGAEWFQKWVMQATEVRLLKGRIKFVGTKDPAPFDSVVAVWRRGQLGWCRVTGWDWRNKA